MALAAMPLISGAQLLKGTTEGNTGPIQVVLTADGDLLAAEYVEVEVGEDGTFTFDRELGKPYEDVSIYVGDMDICGAHLEEGKTLEVAIRRGEDGKVSYEFEGEHARLSEFYTAYVQAFDLMRYLPMNPEDAKPYEENRQILAAEYKKVKGMLKGIRDKKLREHYAALVESGNKNITVRLMEEEANKQGKPAMEFPGYKEVMASVDINDEANVATGLMFSKMKSLIDPALVADGGMSTEYYLAFMKVVEEQVTNPVVRKALTRDCGYIRHSGMQTSNSRRTTRRIEPRTRHRIPHRRIQPRARRHRMPGTRPRTGRNASCRTCSGSFCTLSCGRRGVDRAVRRYPTWRRWLPISKGTTRCRW